VAGVKITASDLEFIYTASSSTFAMSGTASVSVGSATTTTSDDMAFSVKFGHVADAAHATAVPGLAVTNGALVSLDMTVNASVTVAGVKITASDLEFIYTASSSTFAMSGTASVSVGSATTTTNDDMAFSVKFGHDIKNAAGLITSTTPGLVVTNGALISLDMTVNASVTVAGVKITASDLEFIYTASSNTFAMSGTASVSVGSATATTSDDMAFSVKFGHVADATHPNAVPGLVVTNGGLISLDMTVNASVTVAGVKITASNLEFIYTASSSTFAMSGSASVSVGSATFTTSDDIGFQVTLGQNGSPGLVVTNGALQSLDMTLTSGFNVFGTSVTTTTPLHFLYDASQSLFKIQDGGITITAANSAMTLTATFGAGPNVPGLAIRNGVLEALHMKIQGTFTVGSFRISANNLTLDYTSQSQIFGISGGASIAMGPLSAAANFAQVNGHYGIEINTATGAVVLNSFSSTITAALGGGTTFSGSFSYDGINHRYSASGTVPVPYINGTVTAAIALHESGSTLVLDSVTVAYNSNGQTGLSIGSTGVYLTYLSATLGNLGTSSMSFSGSADFNYGGTISVGGHSYKFLKGHVNVFIGQTYKGYVFSGDYTFDLAEGKLGSGSGNLDLNFSQGKYSLTLNIYVPIKGVASITLNLGMAFNQYGTLGIRGTMRIHLAETLPWPIGGTNTNISGFLYSHANGDPDTFGKGVYIAAGWLSFGALGIAGLQVRLNNFKDWIVIHTSSVDFYGNAYRKITDGPIAGALIFADANGNYLFDAGEASTTTDASGRYDPTALSEDMISPLVAIGGIDISTGLPNYAIYTAPSDSLQVNPLTTVVNEMLQQSADKSEDEIRDLAATLLGIPSGINLLTDDLIGMALAGDVGAAHAFATQIQLANATDMIASTLLGQSGLNATDLPMLTSVVYRTQAGRLLANPQSLDLTDPATLADLLNASALAAGITVDPQVATGAATTISNVNEQIAAIPVTGSVEYLNQVAAVQVVAQGLLSTQLAGATAASINGIVASSSGANLTNLISAVQVGEWQAPVLSIADQAAVVGGSGTSSNYTFTVERDSTVSPLESVSIHYATTDGTAIAAHGDYTAAQGTLTWAPGEMGAKTITVHVAGGAAGQAAKEFYVELSNQQNATLAQPVATGIVVYGSPLTTTTTVLRMSYSEYDSGDPTNPADQAIGLQAEVRDQFGHIVPGFVKFSNGDGSYVDIVGINPDTGLAGTNTTLPVGVNDITATYLGYTAGNGSSVIGGSISAVLPQTVTKAGQSIDFPGFDDVTYGTTPLFLRAAATSSLPVSYRVVSGPATIDGEMLHITGIGTVVIEATQAGDEDYNAATPVRQTFHVNPATLTFTANDQFVQFGGPAPQLTGTFSGFINGDGIGSVTTNPTLTVVGTVGDAGTYVITGSGGQAGNYAIQYVAGTLSVVQASTNVTLVATAHNTVYGQAVTLIATVANADGTGTPTGMVSFYDGEVKLDTVSLVDGSAGLIRSDLGVGTHVISVRYEGNTNFHANMSDGQLITVSQDASTIALTIPNTPGAEALTVTAHVTAVSPGAGTPTGEVTFLDGDTVIQVVMLTNGSASLAVGAGVAAQLTVQYSGDVQFLPSLLQGRLSGDALVAVSLNASAGTVVIGTESTLSVDITPADSDTEPAGMVQFLDGTTVLQTVQVVDRTASYTTSLGLGQHTLTAVYLGDDGFQASSNAVSATVKPVDDFAPVFTSPTAFNVNENNSAVGTVMATDADLIPQTVTYRITGGADAARFSLTSGGTLTFSTPPDFEIPTDAGANNIYELEVTADNGVSLTMVQNLVITVNPVNDNAPVFSTTATFSIPENTTAVETVGATDADLPAQSMTYFFSGGADAGRFAMTNAGVLSFLSAPDFEVPLDANANNIYEVQVTANDGNGNTTVQNIQVTVTPVNDNPPVFTTAAAFNVAENQTAVGTLVATDADLAPETVTYRISGGADALMFKVSSNGVLTFASARDFDTPTDAGLNNAYEVQVTADDNNGGTTTQNLTITVTPLNDNSPVFATAAGFSIAENQTAVGTVAATDADLPAQNLQFSISGGADASHFSITAGGVLTFVTAPNFESPGDAGAGNTYHLQVTANDGEGQMTTQNVTVTVTNVSESPVLAGGSGTVTYKKSQPPVTLLPNVTVQSGVGTAALGRLVISVFVPKKGSLADYGIPEIGALGLFGTSGPTDFRKSGGTYKITVELRGAASAQQVQDFLRSITYSSKQMDPAKKPLGRKIEVQVFNLEGSGTPSNVMTTHILAKKK
ncbi:MAG: Cadherin domain protein, partial [Planctomycetaceae bacterium]|nr:Cadherin domain protein [Planctomycetaceae bacterium]